MTENLGETTYERVFDAPRELVYECMITPEHLTQFWGPQGVSTPLESITVDPRPGGAFSMTMVDDASGTEYPSTGVFLELVANERIVVSEGTGPTDLRTTLTFEALDDSRTRLVWHQQNVPAMYLSDEAKAGMASALDRFVAYAAEQAR